MSTSSRSVSKHLGVLRDTELVTIQVHGTHRIYSLNHEAFLEVGGWFGKVQNFWVRSYSGLREHSRGHWED